MYRKFIEEHFGEVHLKGFECLVRACELYAAGMRTMSYIYREVSMECPDVKSKYSIERNIRYYIHFIPPHLLYSCLPRMQNTSNKSVVAAIVEAANNANKEAKNDRTV